MLASLVLFACNPPKDAATGSCSGASETLSVMPASSSRAELVRASSMSDSAADVLENLSGVGGFVTYVAATPNNPKEVMADVKSAETPHLGPFRPQLPVCTVQLFGLPGDAHQYLLWTSRNCIEWSEVGQKGALYLSIFRGRSPLRLEVPRQRVFPSAALRFLDDAAQAAAKQGNATFGPLPRAEASNLERFVVSLKHYYEMDPSERERGENVLLEMLEKKTKQVFEWRQSRIEEWKTSNTPRLGLVQAWTRLTERFVLEQTLQALGRSGLDCGVAQSNQTCQRLLELLSSEHQLAMALAGLSPEYADDMKSKSWKSIRVAAAERDRLFAEVFGALANQARSAALPGPLGSAPSASQPGGLEGLSGASYEQAFLHGFHREKGVSDSAYMPMPLADLFAVPEDDQASPGHAANGVGLGLAEGYATLAPKGAPGQQSPAAKAILFDNRIQMEAFDEGQMVSLFGIVPVAFVSLPGARFGVAPPQYRQTRKEADNEGSLHRARCK